MKKRYDALSVIGSFPLDCVQRRDNGGTCFDLKMTISENRAPTLARMLLSKPESAESGCCLRGRMAGLRYASPW